MYKSYFEALYPARDGRVSIPEDEAIARIAAKIIRGNDDLIWHAESQGIAVPTPNKSARIESRERVSPSGERVRVRASAKFFEAVVEFCQALAHAGF
jgi:hypothetical protein